VGHETDFTICDFVADVRAPTPTAAATLVVPDGEAIARHLAGFAGRWRRAQQQALEARMQRLDSLARRLVHPAARLAQQRRDVSALGERLARAARHRFAAAAASVRAPGQRLAWRLGAPLPQRAQLALARDALVRGMPGRLERLSARLEALAQNLAHLNPEGVLARGYAIVTTADATVVQDAAQVGVGDAVGLRFARGEAAATITRVK
jgi:exodeoxyribonuclease VII large subunit